MIALTNAKKQSPVRSLPEQASVFFSRRYLHAVLAQETAVDSAMERLVVLHCYRVELCG